MFMVPRFYISTCLIQLNIPLHRSFRQEKNITYSWAYVIALTTQLSTANLLNGVWACLYLTFKWSAKREWMKCADTAHSTTRARTERCYGFIATIVTGSVPSCTQSGTYHNRTTTHLHWLLPGKRSTPAQHVLDAVTIMCGNGRQHCAHPIGNKFYHNSGAKVKKKKKIWL